MSPFHVTLLSQTWSLVPPHHPQRHLLLNQALGLQASQQVPEWPGHHRHDGFLLHQTRSTTYVGTPRTWIHGEVISTLGETFCFTSRSKPRNQHYEILPTYLFDLWDAKDHHASI